MRGIYVRKYIIVCVRCIGKYRLYLIELTFILGYFYLACRIWYTIVYEIAFRVRFIEKIRQYVSILLSRYYGSGERLAVLIRILPLSPLYRYYSRHNLPVYIPLEVGYCTAWSKYIAVLVRCKRLDIILRIACRQGEGYLYVSAVSYVDAVKGCAAIARDKSRWHGAHIQACAYSARSKRKVSVIQPFDVG